MMELITRLSTWHEFSAMCDVCDAESTRDRSLSIAAKNAEDEGFLPVGEDGVLCAECVKQVQVDVNVTFS